MTRVGHGKALSYGKALQAATATLWGDDALHAFIVQQKTRAELEKNAFGLHGFWTWWCVCSTLSPSWRICALRGICSASPPCSPGESDFLLALMSQRAEIPLESSGKAVTYCYEQIWNSFSTWLLIRCYSPIFFHQSYDSNFLVFNNITSKTRWGNEKEADFQSWTSILTTPEPHLDQTFVSIWKRLKII